MRVFALMRMWDNVTRGHETKVSGHKFDDEDEEIEYRMYRLQIRNIH